jgi:hypothetical protein
MAIDVPFRGIQMMPRLGTDGTGKDKRRLVGCSALLVGLCLHVVPVGAQTTTTTSTTTECVTDASGNCVAGSTQTTTTQSTTTSGHGGAAAGWGPASVRGVARRTSRRTARRVSRRN